MDIAAFTKSKVKLYQKLLKKAYSFAKEKSYYPEFTRKKAFRRWLDVMIWFLRYHEINGKYNLYGMDVLERDHLCSNYVDYKSFMQIRDKQNYRTISARGGHPQTCLLRDKFLFFQYMTKMGIPVPHVFAVFRNGKYYDGQLIEITVDQLKEKQDYFVKEINGECASYVKHIEDFDELLKRMDELKGKDVIFQERLVQCEEMSRLNPGAVNTMRTVTIRKAGRVEVFASEVRIGTTETGNVDNAAAGGILVGVLPDGHLREYGFIKPGHAETPRIKHHPDTGVAFRDFAIPDYEKAMKLVVRAHEVFYDVKSIGWDVAFTDHGPVLIEGNDNWEITGLQASNGGLKKEWLEAVNE